MSEDSRRRVEVATRIVLRPIASPLPLASLYGGLSLNLEDLQHRIVLPFGRRCEAIEGDLADQVGPVAQEAGVRKQL